MIHQFHMHGEEDGQTRFQAKCGEWFDNALMMTPDGLSLEQALNQGSPLCRSCLSESRRPAGIARLSTRGGNLVDDIGKAWQDRG